MDRKNTEGPALPHGLARFPALARLRLSAGDLAQLSSQGFVATERRGNCNYYKLRFRRAGRQIVRYVGGAAEAGAIETELNQLQSERHLRLELAAFDRAARRLLRESKACLEPLVAANGMKFHGRVVRRPRRAG